MTAHLAAGFANYDERNRDYQTVAHGLRFLRNRTIDDHDSIIWLGDFNYRVGLNNESVRKSIEIGDLATLYQNDQVCESGHLWFGENGTLTMGQLNIQMMAGRAFAFYSEASLTFLPTYRYDIGTDDYDTSSVSPLTPSSVHSMLTDMNREKARIPAWCDRVVWKGNNLRQLSYNTAPLRFSDHKPVYAVFECEILVEDETRKAILNKELRGNGVQGQMDNESSNGSEGSYDLLDPSIAPDGIEQGRWWLKNGRSNDLVLYPFRVLNRCRTPRQIHYRRRSPRTNSQSSSSFESFPPRLGTRLDLYSPNIFQKRPSIGQPAPLVSNLRFPTLCFVPA